MTDWRGAVVSRCPLGLEDALASAPNFFSLATEKEAALERCYAGTSRAGLSERTGKPYAAKSSTSML